MMVLLSIGPCDEHSSEGVVWINSGIGFFLVYETYTGFRLDGFGFDCLLIQLRL